MHHLGFEVHKSDLEPRALKSRMPVSWPRSRAHSMATVVQKGVVRVVLGGGTCRKRPNCGLSHDVGDSVVAMHWNFPKGPTSCCAQPSAREVRSVDFKVAWKASNSSAEDRHARPVQFWPWACAIQNPLFRNLLDMFGLSTSLNFQFG